MSSATIYPTSLAVPRFTHRSLSFLTAIAGSDQFRPVPLLPMAPISDQLSLGTIRMGGGPRTFPGGVSKWQWKRMQAKKAKQLLKTRLYRERQLYQMRKRAELKASISELERPWELVERAPVLFAASADEQVKALADRFQRPGGFDMWSERDGPRIFRSPDDRQSSRLFLNGAVRSVRPYGSITKDIDPDDVVEGKEETRHDDWIARGSGGVERGKSARRSSLGLSSQEKSDEWIGRKNRAPYGSHSESAPGGSSEEVGVGHGHGHRRGDKRLGSVSLRPTTELRVEEAVPERRGSKWREGSNGGSGANRRGGSHGLSRSPEGR